MYLLVSFILVTLQNGIVGLHSPLKQYVCNICLVIFPGLTQLNMAKNSEPILEGFMESTLNFPPTYKFDVGTHTYDTRYIHLIEAFIQGDKVTMD